MFSIEMKINGNLIAYVYGRNIDPEPASTYSVEVYECGKSDDLQQFTIKHRRAEGLLSLCAKVLKQAVKDRKGES